MKNKEINGILLVMLLLFVIAFFGFFIKGPTITGIVIYEETIHTLNWTFDDTNDYVYDGSLIEINDGTAQLVSTTAYTYWNTSAETDYLVTSALYNSDDRLPQVQEVDNKKIQINKNNLFNVIFDNKIDNGDVISLYMENGNEAGIYICDYGEDCSSPGYGSVNFDGSGGWYNTTINNLDEPKNSFNLNPSENIKIDFIKAVHTAITTHESTNISYHQLVSIETNDIDINGLSSFLNFYKNDLLNSQYINYYYSIDSGNNWHNIPDDGDLSGISAANKKIRIKAELSSDGSATPAIYDFSVKYKAQICSENWNLAYGECLSNNTKLKYYADKNDCGTVNDLPTGNGTYESCVYIPPCNEDWNATYGVCLPNSTKLKYYLDKNDCGTITNLPADNGTYEICDYTAPCNEDWSTTYGICLNNNTRLKYYVDENDCGTINDLPLDNGTHEACDYCSPSWSCASYGECQLNNFKTCIAAEDNNLCYNLTNLSSDAYSGDYNEFNLSCVYNKTGTGFSNLSISAVANEKLIIDKTNSTNTILELNASNDIENNFVSITKYSENKRNTSPSLNALNKYLDIEANNSLKNSINSVKIKIYYTDEEIINANLDEETLRIYYFNESSSQWQPLDSTVNTTENYIEVSINHLSTFGIFGEEIIEEISGTSETSSSGGSSSGSGGSTRKITKIAAKPKETETIHEKEETVKEKEAEMPKEAKEECNYKISVSLPEHVSFVESDSIKGIVSNIGNCKIEHLDIGISAELKDVIQIENERIENIEANKNAEFSLIKKLETSKARNLIQGFNIKIPEGSMETYSGSLTFNAVVQDQLAFEQKVDVTVDLLKPISTAEIIKLNIPIFSVLFLILLGLFSVYNYRKRKKNTNHTL